MDWQSILIWGAVVWCVVGALTFAALAAIGVVRRDFDDEPWWFVLIMSAILILQGPLVFCFAVAVLAKRLWDGFIPLTRRPWSVGRALRAEFQEFGYVSRETAICWMINHRRRFDPHSRDEAPPENRPMFELWEEPEAMVLGVVELFIDLGLAGVADGEICRRLEIYRGQTGVAQGASDRGSYVLQRLKNEYPAYVLLGDKVIEGVIEIARQFAELETERRIDEPAYPPSCWFTEKLEIELADGIPAIEKFTDLPQDVPRAAPAALIIPDPRKRQRFLLRYIEGDEIWSFSSSAESWGNLAGRQGYALVRNGQAVAHVVTVMN